LKVALGTLKDKGEELATFLEPRVGAKPSLTGDALEIEDESVKKGVRPRQVKTYIKRFLYMNGVRKNYRVFVAGNELTVQEIELGEEEEEKREAVKKEIAKAEEKEAEVRAEEGPIEEAEEKPKAEKPKKAAAKKPRAKKKKVESED
jgi:sRNA-binding protein